GLHEDVIGMLRRGREDRRAALRAEVARELAPAVAALREARRRSRRDPEVGAGEPHADVERTSGAAPAVLAVAVARGPDGPVVAPGDVAAEAAAGDVAHARIPFDSVRRTPRRMTIS